MSVPKYKRHDSELVVLTKMTELFQKAISISNNEVLIARKNQHFIAEPLLNSVRDMLYATTNANNLNLKDAFEAKMRKDFQYRAFEALNKLTVDVKFCMKYARDEYSPAFVEFLNMIDDCKILLKAWMKHDFGTDVVSATVS